MRRNKIKQLWRENKCATLGWLSVSHSFTTEGIRLMQTLAGRGPDSLAGCTFLDRNSRRIVQVPVEFRCFELPERFVVGFGLDYKQLYRNLGTGRFEDVSARAGAALKLMDNPTQFLSSVQVGITSIGIVNGIIGEAAFSEGLAESMVTWGVSSGVADGLAAVLGNERTAALRCIGNGVVPATAAVAFRELARRAVTA